MDLILVALLTAASALVVGLADPPDALRVPLMLPIAFFTPGYSLTSALYPRRQDLAPLERLGLTFALSLAVLPLVALALNYSPWGVRWEPLLAFVSLLVVLASALGLLHRRLASARDDQFTPSLRLRLPRPPTLVGVLRMTAMAALLIPLATLAVILLVLLAGQRTSGVPHTEFYLLGSGGRPDSFPRTVMVGGEASLIVGITNRETEAKEYSVAVSIDGAPIQEITGLRLDPGQSWQQPLVFTPERAGDRQLVQFDLRMEGAGNRAYRTLYIWLDVLEPLAPPPVEVLSQQRPPTEPPFVLTEVPPLSPTLAPTPTPAPPEPAPTPLPPEPTPTPAPPQPVVHRVVWGENLTRISRQYGVPLRAVIAANPLPNPDLIYPEQRILIPVPGEGE